MSKIKREYYINGQLMYEVPFYQNKYHGTGKWWYENGQNHYEVSYNYGQKHGIEKLWHIDGQISWKVYHLYGKETTEEEYRKHSLITKLSGI